MKKEKSLRERLYQYLLKTHGWVHSGDLQRIVAKYTSYMPSTVARRLRELEEDGKIQVKYEKGSALYKVKTKDDWEEHNRKLLEDFDKA